VTRITEVQADRKVVVDDRFIPPCLTVSAVPVLSNLVSEMVGLLGQRAEALAARLSQPGARGVAEVADFLLLQAINRALPLLAQLARAGNTAAQMLLAVIDKSPALQGPWLSALPREARVGMMRAPGGMSGVSWMRLAAASDPRAAAWVAFWDVNAPVSVVTDFARMGETRAAREALATLTARDRGGFAAIADDPHYPFAYRLPVWREWQGDPALEARLAAEIAALPPGDPLWNVPGILISPHLAGNGNGVTARLEALITENTGRFLSGEPLLNRP
jgi:hypothetical protein